MAHDAAIAIAIAPITPAAIAQTAVNIDNNTAPPRVLPNTTNIRRSSREVRAALLSA
jgi:hypothetical protein